MITLVPLLSAGSATAAGLLAVDKILAGHAYLKGLDKRPFTGEYFRSQLAGALRSRGLCA